LPAAKIPSWFCRADATAVRARVEVGASDRNAWLGDTAITNEWGNVGPDEVGRGDAGCEQLFVVGARFGRLVVAMEEG
jgi:hypothetical protein